MQDLNLQEKVSLTQQVRIIVIEDHSLVRDGICQLLDRYSDLKIVATANRKFGLKNHRVNESRQSQWGCRCR